MKNNFDSKNSQWTRSLNRLRNHFFSRDIEPFKVLLKAHCLKLTRDHHKAEDLYQESLIRSLDLCTICGGPQNIRAYILKTATNLWIDQLRKKKTAEKVKTFLVDERITNFHESTEPLIEYIAAKLPSREFECLILTSVYGYTATEAAELLNTSAAAVKMASSRARKKIKSSEIGPDFSSARLFDF